MFYAKVLVTAIAEVFSFIKKFLVIRYTLILGVILFALLILCYHYHRAIHLTDDHPYVSLTTHGSELYDMRSLVHLSDVYSDIFFPQFHEWTGANWREDHLQ